MPINSLSLGDEQDAAQLDENAQCERALVEAALNGDQQAWNQLLSPLIDRMILVACKILRNTEDAEDAVQNGFLNAFLHLRSFQFRSGFASWLYRIVVNQCISIARRKNFSHLLMTDCDPLGILDSPDTEPLPIVVSESRETRHQVQAVLQMLDQQDRRIILLRYEEGKRDVELQKILNLNSKNTAKTQLLRAIDRFLDQFQECDWYADYIDQAPRRKRRLMV